ncbi:hypothetical protein [Microcoleus vaginatus]|uniref:hypothetical protein n=1 Tax=Microcoleus vaginatus TaxID=119532 RepID=UPI0032A72DBE
MSYQSLIKKAAQPKLNSVPLQKLVLTLDEQAEELLSGGAKEQFIRHKPHVNAGSFL